MYRLLILAAFAGCSASAAAPVAVVTPAKPKTATPVPSVALAPRPDPEAWSGELLPPGTTPIGWVVDITSDGGGFKNRYRVARDPATPNSAPGGSHGPASPSISVKCGPTQSQVMATAGGFNWNAVGIAVAPGGTSFTATGTVREAGQPDRPFTAVVTAVP